MHFLSKTLIFSNYKKMRIVLSFHLKGCDLCDVVEEKPSHDISKEVYENKEEKAFTVLQKTIHQKIWKQIR